LAPDIGSFLWWPARALLGDAAAVAGVLAGGICLLRLAVMLVAPRFADCAIAAAGVVPARTRQRRHAPRFRRASPNAMLRRKEWTLLLRDPWLVSQTLMQLLYLLPPAFLLWRSFYNGSSSSALLVPILIIAAGQLAGSLAWLAISGEDAPDLIASAPVTTACAVRAKTEAVMGVIAVIFGPFVVTLLFIAPISALIAGLGVAGAA